MSELQSLAIVNCRVVLPDRILDDGWILVGGGCVIDVGQGGAPSTRAAIHDARGQFVGPGFVDVHCHGDTVTRFFDDPETVARQLVRGGVTSVLATLGYPDMTPDIPGQLRRYQSSLGPWASAVCAGVHLEGPYVNRKYGAQTSRGVIKVPVRSEYEAIVAEFGNLVRWWTCAPELPGAADFIRVASARGIIVGAGHSEATPDEIAESIRCGLRVIIHWSNATGNPRAAVYLGTRSPGIDEAALVFDELSAEVIPDERGLHVHPLMARLLYKAKGPDRVLVITDAGYRRTDDPPEPAGPRRDVSIDADGNLAGSRLSMAQAARNFRNFSGCSWPELFRMAALNAAKLLRMDDTIGSIARGRRANLVVFHDELVITDVFLGGEKVPREGA